MNQRLIKIGVKMLNIYLMMIGMIHSIYIGIYMWFVRIGLVKRTRILKMDRMDEDRCRYMYSVNWSFFDSSIFYFYASSTQLSHIPAIGYKTKEEYRKELIMSRHTPTRVVINGSQIERDITEIYLQLMGPNPLVEPVLHAEWILKDYGSGMDDEWIAFYPQHIDRVMELMLLNQPYGVMPPHCRVPPPHDG